MADKEMTLDQKFAKALFNLRDLRPFFSAVYESIPHIETKSIDTMAVNGKEFLYNPDFADSIEFSEFLFSILHEVGHIALMHVPRREMRDPLLWNIACDLYVNAVIVQEFELDTFESRTKKRKDRKAELVKLPKGVLYCSSVSIDNDTSEYIYSKLAEQAKINKYFEKSEGSFTFEFEGTSNNVGASADKRKFKITINKQAQYDFSDLVDDGSDSEEVSSENKRIVSEAQVKYSMTYGNSVSGGTGILEKLVASILTSHIDWRKLLRKYCISITSKDSSFRVPDKRMYYQSAIYPGSKGDDTKALERVKICFDRSGSISDNDMRYFYGQARALLKEFKVEAEVVDWDTEILGTSSMSKPELVTRANIIHGGGTDPSCVFEYFDSKKCKMKPLVTVIFTDGFIAFTNKAGWAKKYKNTIWVMTRDYNKDFKPEFGKIAIATFKD